ncbi:hypothetical protein, partial [Robertmurraya sp.]|uniref:hypothetical protein n=1 Tax=Robertmurraya sp. TaxID=2837525 RepID=UPI003703AF03
SDFICDFKNLFAIPRFYLRFLKLICDHQNLFAIPETYLRSSKFICDLPKLFAVHNTYLLLQAIAKTHHYSNIRKSPESHVLGAFSVLVL